MQNIENDIEIKKVKHQAFKKATLKGGFFAYNYFIKKQPRTIIKRL